MVGTDVEVNVDGARFVHPKTDETWKKLRRQIKREQRKWEDTSLNKEGRTVAAAMWGAYGGVLRMMDKLEEDAAQRVEP